MPAAVIDLPRVQAARARLDAAVAGLDARGRARLADFAAALAEGDPAAVATVNGDPMPKLRDPENALSEPFTIRVSPVTLAALDDLANELAADPIRSGGRPVNRQATGRMALEAGMRTLAAELAGKAPRTPAEPYPEAVAEAVFSLLQARGAIVVGTVGDYRAKLDSPPEAAAVGRPGTVARRPPPRLVVDADAEPARFSEILDKAKAGGVEVEPEEINAMIAAGGLHGQPVPVDEDRRAPTSKPRPGGQRRDPPPSDPPERRGADRLTAADVGQWVREGDNARTYSHRIDRIGGGGTVEFACGRNADLRFVERTDGGRRCAKCDPAGGAP